MVKDFYFLVLQYIELHPYILPLGIIGLWRWAVWVFKEIIALGYRPKVSSYHASISLITPVYNENPKIFSKALASWQKNKPNEIIAVIDYTDPACIQLFKSFAKKHPSARLIITRVPGKRPALASGIKTAKGTIVALVDSDTIWDNDVIKNGLAPFIDPKVAGVGTYQNVLQPKTLAQKIFDVQLDLRYSDEMPFLAAAGDALICLSGRTAFYRRKIIVPMLHALVHETFMGKPVISGDDKRLTYLVLAAGWKVTFQSNAHVYTPGMPDIYAYLQQRLRWSRNSLRADLRALRDGWPRKHPALLFFQIDKVFQALVVLLSPIYFFVSLIIGAWHIAVLLLVWWIFSRAVRMYPHLRRRPQDFTLIPAFIVYSFFTGFVKIYAFFTLNTQGWITRWHANRLANYQFVQLLPGYAATALVFVVIIAAALFYKYYSYYLPHETQKGLVATTLLSPSREVLAYENEIATHSAKNNKDLLVKKHVVKDGETLSTIAQAFGVTTDNLLMSNIARLTNWNTIEPGFLLSIPGKDVALLDDARFNYQRVYPDVLQTTYEESTNTILVSGRGKHTTLKDIQNSVGEKYLKEIVPKVWFLTAHISLRSGVSLTLSKDEVTWLKMQSRHNRFTTIQGYNATVLIDGVKITSWDDTKNTYDTDMSDKRSYILVKSGSRMDIYNAELAYLGYARDLNPETSPYGVSWRMPPANRASSLLTGEIINSRFHHNYFGVYTFGATGMLWRGNEFYNNTRYGFDPHDDSNGFLIENNVAYDNGTHGFIVSKRCLYNTFRKNVSYNNKLHGIMLHESSNNNILENNTIYGNIDGVAIWHSSNNSIRNNTLYANKRGIRANEGSINNSLIHNDISESKEYGIYLYKNAGHTIIKKNNLYDNEIGIYIKTDNNVITSNVIRDNNKGIYFLGTATNNIIVQNEFRYHTQNGIYTKIPSSSKNYLAQNTFTYNRKDIYAQKIAHPVLPENENSSEGFFDFQQRVASGSATCCNEEFLLPNVWEWKSTNKEVSKEELLDTFYTRMNRAETTFVQYFLSHY